MEKTDLGQKPRLEFHPPSNLVVDDRYQRSIAQGAGKRLIAKIVKEFNWAFYGVLVATDNGDGTYCLIDGQHRAEAARQHPDVHSVPVMVIEEMTLAEQAQAFVAINQGRVKLNALQLHRASVRAGDPHAIELDTIAKECGVNIPGNAFSTLSIKPGQTLAVMALSKILTKFGAKGLRTTLQTVMAAYSETTGDLRAQIFTGTAIAVFLNPNHTEQIAKKLSEADVVSWQERARARGKIDGTATPDALATLLTSKIKPQAAVA